MLIPGRAKALPVLFFGAVLRPRGGCDSRGEPFAAGFAHTARMDESIEQGWKPLLRGTALAAAVAGVALASTEPLRRGSLELSDFGMALFAFYFALPAVIVIGVPLFLTLRWLGWARWWSSALAGVAGGAAIAAIVRWPGAPSLSDLPLLCAVGAASALAFWWAVRRKPASRG